VALAVASGSHGVYVHNALCDGTGETLALYGAERLLGLCWFGPRGNLILLQHGELDGPAVARAVQSCQLPWRIVLGARPGVDALAAHVRAEPLVHRDQDYFAALPADVPAELVQADVRPARAADAPALVSAALQLNESDLRVDPRRVDRRWLHDTVHARIADESTRVIEQDGRVLCKLDLGSQGPGGLVVEGVFTFPEARGRGLATRLVASVIARAGCRVCLHVAADNVPARMAYARAGMRPSGSCRLLLLR
jgi:GNAT superfamily N-acetyltransferase